MQKDIKVIIADDHKIFRDGFKLVLESMKNLVLKAEAENGEEFLKLYQKHKPDLVFLDIKMPKIDGIQAARMIKSESDDTKIIILTAIEDSDSIHTVIESGVDGFLLKSADYKTIEKAVNNVLSGQTFFSEDIFTDLDKQNGNKKKHADKIKLTKRETEVLNLVCAGLSVPQISERLNISSRTIEKHKENIMLKTNTNRTSELIVFAIRHKLVRV